MEGWCRCHTSSSSIQVCILLCLEAGWKIKPNREEDLLVVYTLQVGRTAFSSAEREFSSQVCITTSHFLTVWFNNSLALETFVWVKNSNLALPISSFCMKLLCALALYYPSLKSYYYQLSFKHYWCERWEREKGWNKFIDCSSLNFYPQYIQFTLGILDIFLSTNVHICAWISRVSVCIIMK